MNDRKVSLSSHDPGEPMDVEAAPMAPRVDSCVVFCGDAQRLSEGFAFALRAIGVGGPVGPAAHNQNKEDT
jgi:hypothetical protein